MSISLGDDIIDSRDIMKRIEELHREIEDAEIELEDLTNEHDTLDAIQEEIALIDDKIGELEKELECWKEFEGCGTPDWYYGEAFIDEDYFEDYIVDLVTDCYEFPKEFGSDHWPWRHLTMDWAAAAEEAKVDYLEVEVDNHTYLARA